MLARCLGSTSLDAQHYASTSGTDLGTKQALLRPMATSHAIACLGLGCGQPLDLCFDLRRLAIGIAELLPYLQSFDATFDISRAIEASVQRYGRSSSTTRLHIGRTSSEDRGRVLALSCSIPRWRTVVGDSDWDGIVTAAILGIFDGFWLLAVSTMQSALLFNLC